MITDQNIIIIKKVYKLLSANKQFSYKLKAQTRLNSAEENYVI